MIKRIFVLAAFAGSLLLSVPAMSQSTEKPLTPAEKKLRSDKEQDTKAADWTKSLNLNDAAKEARVAQLISTHLKATRDWNNEHPFSTVPAGINPFTGNKLTDQDRQIIAQSAMPKSIHDDLMTGLRKELTEEQVEAILDKYTIGKVAFTLQGYKSIVPDLTKEEETKILGFLKQAREQAIDYKSMKQISAIFEIYKNKCEQYLNNNGRNWRQLFKAYVDKVKAEKAAAAQKDQPAKK
nr:DUF3826 domain-containing protein [Parabacteroides sp. FAFU027]